MFCTAMKRNRPPSTGENLASVLAHVGDGEVLKPAYDRL